MTEPCPCAEWNFPTRILLGRGVVRELDDLLVSAGLKAPLIIIDKIFATSPSVKKLLRNIEKTGIGFGVFSEIGPLANGDDLSLGLETCRNGAFDAIIAFGSATAIDFGKLMALQTNIPVFAIPVFGHYGAEAIPQAIMCDRSGEIPHIEPHKTPLPTTVFYDPELTLIQGTPILADSGMAILTRAVEAWCADRFNPAADALACEAIRIVFTYLPKILAQNYDITAQSYMMSAAFMAAQASLKGTGATTAFANTFTMLYALPYGMVAGSLLPHVLAFNSSIIDSRLHLLADRLDIKGGSTGFAKALLKLRGRAGVPGKLTTLMQGMKLSRKDKLLIEQIATEDPAASANPARFTQKAAHNILEAALTGKMKRT